MSSVLLTRLGVAASATLGTQKTAARTDRSGLASALLEFLDLMLRLL